MSCCIENNPFRVLGVYSNASARDIASNKSRLQAYLKVNREISFPIDGVVRDLLIRNQEKLDNALSQINLPQDKIKHALFWYIKTNSLDDMAIQHLASGNPDKFVEILERKDDFSTRINRGVYELSCGDFDSAVSDITYVIHDDDERDDFVSAVCGDTFTISEDDLAHVFIDTLLDEYPDEDWIEIFRVNGESADDDDYLLDKIAGKPISEINAEIAKAKSVNKDDPEANLSSGKHLIVSTKDNLSLLKNILGSEDSQYQMIADKLANQILQNGINYFNNVDDAEGIDEAMKIQSYAKSIAVGKVAKDRCTENVEILKDIKQKLPPLSCRYHDDVIKKNIIAAIGSRTCESAIKLIKDSFIYLQSVKAEVGSNHQYYLRISTEVAKVALGLVIDDFNATFNDRLKVELILDRENTISKVKRKCRSALTATLYMDQLDMESDFKNGRYATNKSTLKGQASQIDVYVSSSAVKLDRRNEDTIFANAHDIFALDEYLKLFPKGKYVNQCYQKRQEFEYNACKTSQDCDNFKRKYPNASFDIESKREECVYNQCKSIADYRRYLSSYPSGRYHELAENKIVTMEFKSCNSLNDFQSFVAKYPASRYTNDAIKAIDDEKAWAQACSLDQKSSYKDYLAKFPSGRHYKEAQGKASACYIATMVYGDYNCPEVVALRSFRDNVLRHNSLGQSFIAFYYRNSPQWVERMKENKLANTIIRHMLDIFVKIYTR